MFTDEVGEYEALILFVLLARGPRPGCSPCVRGLPAHLIRRRNPQRCFQAFMNNNWFGAAVFAGILLHYTFATQA